MRRNSVRHFVHMVIDILPLLIIPIFALNILHKETEPISIEVQEKESLDFNQLYICTDYSYTRNGVTFSRSAETQYIKIFGTNDALINFPQLITIPDQVQNHKYYFKYTGIKEGISWLWQVYNNNTFIANKNFWTPNEYIYTFNDINANLSSFVPYQATNNTYINVEGRVNIYDLTQIFGSGNEPTIEEFNTYFPNDYYDYTESQKMLVNKPSLTTYNDTDIGSQFVYALYKPVNDYFNFNNLFNMGAIYNWIELNLFSGTAPLPIFIIWNVIVYEFFVDLIFLLYAVFMFVIDFSTSMIDKFMYKSRRGI